MAETDDNESGPNTAAGNVHRSEPFEDAPETIEDAVRAEQAERQDTLDASEAES